MYIGVSIHKLLFWNGIRNIDTRRIEMSSLFAT